MGVDHPMVDHQTVEILMVDHPMEDHPMVEILTVVIPMVEILTVEILMVDLPMVEILIAEIQMMKLSRILGISMMTKRMAKMTITKKTLMMNMEQLAQWYLHWITLLDLSHVSLTPL